MPTTTTFDAAQLLPLSELTNLAVAHRQQIDAEAAEEERERIAHEIADAADDAHRHIQTAFPATLARVLPSQAWAGYWEGDHPDRDRTHAAVAVAYLGNGMWLRHVHHRIDLDDANHELALLSPCACRDYTEALVRDGYALAGELEYAQERRDICDCLPF